MRHLALGEVLFLHQEIIATSGGATSLRDLGPLEAAMAQPRMTFDDANLYPDLVDKAATLAYGLINNHPFVDGNNRAGHAALEIFLLLNGHELTAIVESAEAAILGVASGTWERGRFATWVRTHGRNRGS